MRSTAAVFRPVLLLTFCHTFPRLARWFRLDVEPDTWEPDYFR